MNTMKKITIIGITVLLGLIQACSTKTEKQESMKTDKNELNAIFPMYPPEQLHFLFPKVSVIF